MRLAIALLVLIGPDGQPIEVNPAAIVTMRAPRSVGQAALAPGTNCVITTLDGKFVNVINTCDDVHAQIAAMPK